MHEIPLNGFLLAAGRGSRLAPLTDKTAKPALPIAGLPMLAYSLNFFYAAAVKKLCVNTHHAPKTITDVLNRLEHPWEFKISHEPVLLETGGGVKACEHFIRDAPVLLANGDVVCDLDVSKLLRFHNARKSALTLVVVKHPQANTIAPITIGEGDQILDINRTLNVQSSGDHLYAGIALFEPILFEYLKREPSSIVYTGYTGLIAAGHPVSAYIHDERWYDCGTPESYAQVNRAVTADAWHWDRYLNPKILRLRN